MRYAILCGFGIASISAMAFKSLEGYFKSRTYFILTTVVLLFSSLSFGESNSFCHRFYASKIYPPIQYSKKKVAEVLEDVPGLKSQIQEIMADSHIPTSIKRIIKRAIQDENLEVVQLTDQLRKAWKVPDFTEAFAHHPGGKYNTWTYNISEKTTNEIASLKIETNFKNENDPDGRGVAVSDRAISESTNDLSYLIHELAHVRMETFLRKNWDRICEGLPGTLAFKHEDGYWVMNAQLRDLLHEKYAHESEFQLLNSAYGTYFHALPKKWAAVVNSSYAQRQSAIGDYLVREYKFSDPFVIALAKEPISTILLRGKKLPREIQEQVYLFFAWSNQVPLSREEVQLNLALIQATLVARKSKTYRPLTPNQFSTLLSAVLKNQDGVSKANDILSSMLSKLEQFPEGREDFLRIIDSHNVRYLLDSMGWLVSPAVSLTFSDVIRGSAKTRILFEQEDLFSDPIRKALFEIVNTGHLYGMVGYPLRKKFENYRDADEEANYLKHARKVFASNLPELKRPIYESRAEGGVLGRLKKNDWDYMLKFWGRLGVKKEFEEAYQNPDSFWNSRESIVEIYLKLKQTRL